MLLNAAAASGASALLLGSGDRSSWNCRLWWLLLWVGERGRFRAAGIATGMDGTADAAAAAAAAAAAVVAASATVVAFVPLPVVVVVAAAAALWFPLE
jgi:hypothetical protein